mmetsp:Transcript_78580/g.228082  ORF Transcript_78580/g.228082 Transcript_78580/m.228082 type:complete len:263 (-) Transcript_78580:606-1394(-)
MVVAESLPHRRPHHRSAAAAGIRQLGLGQTRDAGVVPAGCNDRLRCVLILRVGVHQAGDVRVLGSRHLGGDALAWVRQVCLDQAVYRHRVLRRWLLEGLVIRSTAPSAGTAGHHLALVLRHVVCAAMAVVLVADLPMIVAAHVPIAIPRAAVAITVPTLAREGLMGPRPVALLIAMALAGFVAPSAVPLLRGAAPCAMGIVHPHVAHLGTEVGKRWGDAHGVSIDTSSHRRLGAGSIGGCAGGGKSCTGLEGLGIRPQRREP